jgi:hypothetical protein
METLITIAVIVVALVWHAIQKRKEEEEAAKTILPPTNKGHPQMAGRPMTEHSPSRSELPRSWEEELRRLLTGESPEAPPVITSPAPVPPPIPAPAPRHTRPLLEPANVGALGAGRRSVALGRVAGAPVMPSLSESAQALHRASRLETTVAQRLRDVDDQLVSHAHALSPTRASEEIRQGVRLLRSRPSQRAAIVASVVLGSPKALDD